MKDSANGLRILIVEDNPGDRYLITELLNASVIKTQLVSTAETLGKAIELLKKEIFDIILLDLSLPDSAGIDTFKTIKEFTGKMPVIILSGLTDMTIAVEAIALGAQDYHVKGDLDEKMLTKTILYSIERKRSMEELLEITERFEMITRTTNDSLWEWNFETGKLWSNETHRHLYGFTISDPVPAKKMWVQQVHPDDRERMIKVQTEALASDKNVFISEYRFLTVENGYRDIYDRCYIVRNQQGEPVRMMGSMTDITERKKAEEMLKESEFQFRKVTENPILGVAWASPEGKVINANSTFCKLLGYRLEELKNVYFGEFTHPEDTEKELPLVEQIIQGKIDNYQIEKRYKTKQGEYIWVELNLSSYRTATDNRIEFFIGIVKDIHEKKKTEEAIIKSEERYRSVIEQAVDAIALYDESGKILDVNTGSVKLLGYSKKELMQMYLPDILSEEEAKMEPVQYDVLQKGESTVNQRIMRRKDGSVVQTEVRSQQLPDGRFLSVIRDLTERAKAQEQIQREKELSDSIINSLPGLFYLVEESGKYIRWNKQKEEIGGYTADEMSRMTPLDFFEGDEKELVRQRIKDGFTKGATDIEAHLVTKKGNRILFYFTGIAIEYEGKKCLMGTGIDISDRKKGQQELEESYKAIRKLTEHLQNIREEERAHMAREIHDELGQQLTVLKMDVSWLNKKITSPDENISKKMKGLLSMLDETVQTVRRISSELRPSLLDDLGLTAAMEWQLGEFEKRSGIKTRFDAPETEIELPAAVKTALFRIFQESLTNVARHSDAKKLNVSMADKDNNFVLSVIDDGKGFDKQKVAEGKTLGILGMQERTSMIGGTYKITSKPGKGTAVEVVIPLTAPIQLVN